jgi:excisionase family DNA binding protein
MVQYGHQIGARKVETEFAVVTIAEAADILKVHHHTIRRWIKDGALRAIKFRRCVRILRSELLRLMERKGAQGA